MQDGVLPPVGNRRCFKATTGGLTTRRRLTACITGRK